MEQKDKQKDAQAVAGTSTKPDLKRKLKDDVKELDEDQENTGPIPIMKLEVCLHSSKDDFPFN